MILHLGVNDVPYSHSANTGKSKTGKQRVSTTGEVAEILEDKYSVMGTFWSLHQDEVVAELEGAIGGALETLLTSESSSARVSESITSDIEDMFQKFLSGREMDGVVAGVPTAAAQAGVSHRFKHPYARRAPRPSFIDTGLYESSFKAWVD